MKRVSRLSPATVVVSLLVLLLVSGCAPLEDRSLAIQARSDAPQSSRSAPLAEPPRGIEWHTAGDHLGSIQRVCGPFMNSGASADDVFLNLGKPYPDPDRFTVVLWDVGGVQDPAPGSTICVEGLISSYRGVTQIELRSIDDVEVYR